MKFQVEINCDNAAFDPDFRVELSRILVELSGNIISSRPGFAGVVYDLNGNPVGTWAIPDGE